MAASSAEYFLGNLGVESWTDITPEKWLELMEYLPQSAVERKNIVQRLCVLARFDLNREMHPEYYEQTNYRS